MYPGAKRAVIEFLKAQLLPGYVKRDLLKGWALTVGVKLKGRHVRAVEESGIDELQRR